MQDKKDLAYLREQLIKSIDFDFAHMVQKYQKLSELLFSDPIEQVFFKFYVMVVACKIREGPGVSDISLVVEDSTEEGDCIKCSLRYHITGKYKIVDASPSIVIHKTSNDSESRAVIIEIGGSSNKSETELAANNIEDRRLQRSGAAVLRFSEAEFSESPLAAVTEAIEFLDTDLNRRSVKK